MHNNKSSYRRGFIRGEKEAFWGIQFAVCPQKYMECLLKTLSPLRSKEYRRGYVSAVYGQLEVAKKLHNFKKFNNFLATLKEEEES